MDNNSHNDAIMEDSDNRPDAGDERDSRRHSDRHDADESQDTGNQNGNRQGPESKKQMKNLLQVTHESNDSTRRRRKRAQVNKLKGRVLKKKKRSKDDDGQLDYSGEFDFRSPTEEFEGYLQIVDGGHGFIRSPKQSFTPSELDLVVPRDLVHRFHLRTGLFLKGLNRIKRNRRQRVAVHLLDIQGKPAKEWTTPAGFQTLTSVNPYEFFRLSSPQDNDKSTGLMELLTPIGKGQRGLLVAPPRTGKTILMEKIANGIAHNHPDVDIMLLLIDERPEEVTHLSRRVNAQVWASCLDKPNHEHVALCQMVTEIAQRKVEEGKDVVILLDSITRMARAFNNQLKSSGRTLSGGVDAKALHEPKKFFGAARKLEEGGSLTIIATALVQTGSQMDEVIFQEFKGTGNMELVLNRKLAEKRIYPAIDIGLSGTRREELILPPEYHRAAVRFRRYLNGLTESNQMPAAIQAMEKYRTTHEFVDAFV